jgi:hypothetical protein
LKVDDFQSSDELRIPQNRVAEDCNGPKSDTLCPDRPSDWPGVQVSGRAQCTELVGCPNNPVSVFWAEQEKNCKKSKSNLLPRQECGSAKCRTKHPVGELHTVDDRYKGVRNWEDHEGCVYCAACFANFLSRGDVYNHGD